eukprot:scaffold74631_cov20-Tisochrysis_lutea.AAC.1
MHDIVSDCGAGPASSCTSASFARTTKPYGFVNGPATSKLGALKQALQSLFLYFFRVIVTNCSSFHADRKRSIWEEAKQRTAVLKRLGHVDEEGGSHPCSFCLAGLKRVLCLQFLICPMKQTAVSNRPGRVDKEDGWGLA